MLAFLVWISDLAARGGGDDAERTSYFVRPYLKGTAEDRRVLGLIILRGIHSA